MWATAPSKKTTSLGVRADVEQADAEFALVGGERGFGRGDGLEDGLGNFKAGLLAQVTMLCSALAEQVAMCRLTSRRLPTMPTGSWMPGCSSRMNCCGKQMEDFAIGRERDGAGAVDGGAYIFARDLAHARAEADAATAVQAADVRSANGDDAALDGGLSNVFGEGGGLVDGFDCGADLGDDSFAGPLGVDDAVAAIAEGSIIELGDEDTSLRRAGVEDGDEIVGLLAHPATFAPCRCEGAGAGCFFMAVAGGACFWTAGSATG